MQGSSWSAFLERVPPEQLDNLLFITNNGTGIAIKGVIRAESDYVVVRGRLLGAAEEGGGFFFVPYDQINFVGFQRLVKESVVLSMYDGKAPPTRLGSPAKPEADGSDGATGLSTTPAATPSPDSDSGTAKPAAAPGKAALLERLRARRDEMPNP